MTFIPEEASPNIAPSSAAQPLHFFTIEELPDGEDNFNLANVDIIHPDELEEYRSDDDDEDDDEDDDDDDDDVDSDTDTRIHKVPQDTDTSDTPDSDTAAIAHRMRRLRTNDKSRFASTAPSQRRQQQQQRRAAALSSPSSLTTGMAGKKRSHIQQQDVEANTASYTDTDSESVFAPDDQDVHTSARRLRRRVRGPAAEISSLSPVSKDTAFEAGPTAGQQQQQQHFSTPDSEAMDVDSNPSDPAA